MKNARIYGRNARDRKLRRDAAEYLAGCLKVGAVVLGSHLAMGLLVAAMDALF